MGDLYCVGPSCPSIKYVTLFRTNFDPPSVTHLRTPKVRHTPPNPPFFSSTYIHMSLQGLFVLVRWSFCPGDFVWVFCLEGFVWGGFCPSTLLSEYIRYNRKVNITFNFRFHMYEKNFKSVTSHTLGSLPMSQTVTPSRTPLRA